MMNAGNGYDRKETLPAAILRSRQGLKAETILASAIADGFSREDFIVRPEQFFERPYREDITDAGIWEDEWRRLLVEVRLSRPGFYDRLPEGLFFQPAAVEYNSAMGVTEMAALYRRNKTREKGIRNFFQPFEQATFYQQLQLEEEERGLLQGLGMLHRHFRKFWNIPEQIGDMATDHLVRLIPYAHRICGHLPLMQPTLELLLRERVTVRLIPPSPTPVGRDMEKGLGEQSLGDDMVCGSSFMEGYPVYKYTIGPLDPARVGDCLPGGRMYLVIETFNRFFVPAEAGIETQVEIITESAGMTLGQEPVLGYSALL